MQVHDLQYESYNQNLDCIVALNDAHIQLSVTGSFWSVGGINYIGQSLAHYMSHLLEAAQ